MGYILRDRPKDFLVLSGSCHVDAEMLRTYSRIRLTLNNESTIEDLTLNSFSFETAFSQKQTYLFDFGDGSRFADFGNGAGAPLLDAADAIHAYPGDGLIIPAEESRVIYDAYILESRRGEDMYKYKVDVEYAGINTEEITLTDGTPIFTAQALKTAWIAGHYKYLLKSLNSSRGCLYDNTLNESVTQGNRYVRSENYNVQQGNVKTWLDKNIMGGTRSTTLLVDPATLAITRKDGGVLTDLRLDGDYAPFIWTLERAGDGQYFIFNEATGQYWDKSIVTNDNNIKLRTTTIGYSYFIPVNFVNGSISGVAFQNGVSSGAPCYLFCDGYGHASNGKNTTNDMWALYACNSGMPAAAVKVIPLQIIDPLTHQPENLEELDRNDYIKVNIFTSVQSDGGIISFKVIPWIPKEGSIEFE